MILFVIWYLLAVSQGISSCVSPCLYYTVENRLFQQQLNSSNGLAVGNETLLSTVDGVISAIAVNAKNKFLFYGVIKKDRTSLIIQLSLNNLEEKILFSNDVGLPSHIVIDWSSNNLYWVNTEKHVIEVGNIKTEFRKVIVNLESGMSVFGLCVHPERGLYWIAHNPKEKLYHEYYIRHVSLSGNDVKDIYKQTVGWLDFSVVLQPRDLQIDFNENRLIWIDISISTDYAGVYSLPLKDNSVTNQVTLISMTDKEVTNRINGLAYYGKLNLAYLEQTDYISILQNKKISTTLKERKNSNFENLVVLDDDLPLGYPTCRSSNCSHLCFPTSNTAYTCGCSYRYLLNSDGRTCQESKKQFELFVLDEDTSGVQQITKYFGLGVEKKNIKLKLKANIKPHGISFNIHKKEIYITETSKNMIFRVNSSSGEAESIFTNASTAIAVSQNSDIIFWLKNEVPTALQVSTLFGNRTFTKTFQSTIPKANDMVYYEEKGYIFVTGEGVLQVMRIDIFTGEMIQYEGAHQKVTGVAIDKQEEMLYWCSKDRIGLESFIKASNLNLQKVSTILSAKLYSPFSIAIDGDYIYWSDSTWNSIYRLSKHPLEQGEPSLLSEGFGGLRDLVIAEEYKIQELDTIYFLSTVEWKNSFKVKCFSDVISCESYVKDNNISSPPSCPSGYQATALLSGCEYCKYSGTPQRCPCTNPLTCKQREFGFDHGCTSSLNPVVYISSRECKKFQGLPACKINNGGCSHICLSKGNRTQCECPNGMFLDDTRKNCTIQLNPLCLKEAKFGCDKAKWYFDLAAFKCKLAEDICISGSMVMENAFSSKEICNDICKAPFQPTTVAPTISPDKAPSAKNDTYLYIAKGSNLYRFKIGDDGQPVNIKNTEMVWESENNIEAFDASMSSHSEIDVFFASANRLWRVKKGSNSFVESFLIGFPTAIAYDSLHNRLYFVSPQRSTIDVLDFNENKTAVILSTGIDPVNDMIVDPVNGFIFWCISGSRPRIERSDLAGGNRIVLNITKIYNPTSLTFDFNKKRLFWLEATNYTVSSVNYEGDMLTILPFNETLTTGIPQYSITYNLLERMVYITNSNSLYAMKYENNLTETTVISKNLIGCRRIKFVSQIFNTTASTACHNRNCSFICLPASHNTSQCACAAGEVWNNLEQRCDSAAEDWSLFFTTEKGVYQMTFYKNVSSFTVFKHDFENNQPHQIAYNAQNQVLYWTENLVLHQTDLMNLTLQKNILILQNDEFAFDHTQNVIYYHDNNAIVMSTTDGKHKKTLFNHIVTARSLIVAERQSYIYYISGAVTISRITRSGSLKEIHDAGHINLLAADDKNLYWYDSSPLEFEPKIKFTDLEFNGEIKVLLKDVSVSSLAVIGDKLLWSDPSSNRIHSVNKFSGGNQQGLLINVNVKSLLYVYERNKIFISPCSVNNGKCSHFCLHENDQAKCVCPDNMQLDGSHKNCIKMTPSYCGDYPAYLDIPDEMCFIAGTSAWYYDYKDKVCKMFCDPYNSENKNTFNSEMICNKTCFDYIEPTSQPPTTTSLPNSTTMETTTRAARITESTAETTSGSTISLETTISKPYETTTTTLQPSTHEKTTSTISSSVISSTASTCTEVTCVTNPCEIAKCPFETKCYPNYCGQCSYECKAKNSCKENVCENNGICIEVMAMKQCRCSSLWFGKKCKKYAGENKASVMIKKNIDFHLAIETLKQAIAKLFTVFCALKPGTCDFVPVATKSILRRSTADINITEEYIYVNNIIANTEGVTFDIIIEKPGSNGDLVLSEQSVTNGLRKLGNDLAQSIGGRFDRIIEDTTTVTTQKPTTEEDSSYKNDIIIACVIGGLIVLFLTVVLVMYSIRQHRTKKSLHPVRFHNEENDATVDVEGDVAGMTSDLKIEPISFENIGYVDAQFAAKSVNDFSTRM